LVRQGSTIRFYINGVQSTSASSSQNFTDPNCRISGFIDTQASPYGYFGYISNARVVKGTCLYPSGTTFTPSITPLTAVSGTSLLTCQGNRFFDASSNALAITVNGSPSVQGFSPFAPLTVYNPATYGGSGYFNGSSNLSFADNVAFQLGSGAFTIECWFYKTASGNAAAISKWNAGGTDSNAAWDLDFESGNIRGIVASGSSVTSITSTEPALNTWNHAAFVRSGNTLSLFVNGSRVGTTTFSGSVNNGTQAVLVGQISPSSFGGYIFTGYISNARVVKGTAVYDPTQTTYAVPTAPLTAVTGTVLLTNTTNPAILDNSMMNDLETVGNAAVSTSVKKYGAASMVFDGSGDYLKTLNNGATLTLGTGDFTVEFWLYANTVATSYQGLIDWRPSDTSTYPAIFLNTSAVIWGKFGGAMITSSAISATTWYHVAVCRSGSSTKMFINGTQSGSTYTDTNNYLSNTTILVGSTFANEYFNGYIDDLRITKGVARYTANFTAPTTAFPNG
jgi:hypothetical protein